MNKKGIIVIISCCIIIGIICSVFFIINKSKSNKVEDASLEKESKEKLDENSITIDNEQILANDMLNEIVIGNNSLLQVTDKEDTSKTTNNDNSMSNSEVNNNRNSTSSSEVNSNGNSTSGSEVNNNDDSASNSETTNKSPSQTTNQENISEYPSSLQMLPSGDIHISVGDTYQLNIVTRPSKVKDSSGTWSSSDTSIATVDSNGVVTGIRNGFCNVTFTSANGISIQKLIGVYYTILGTKEFNRTIYNKNGIVVTANNFVYDMTTTSSPFYFTVTNNNEETINAYVSTVPSFTYSNCGLIINGQKFTVNSMSDICLAHNLVTDTTKKSYISIYQDYFRKYQIKKINTMSFYIMFCDENNNYKYSSDLITINF